MTALTLTVGGVLAWIGADLVLSVAALCLRDRHLSRWRAR